MNIKDVKTLDIIGKTWFDKVNGNTYNSARLILNFGMEDEKTFCFQMTYGYGDFYSQRVYSWIAKKFDLKKGNDYFPSYKLRDDFKIVIRDSVTKGLKRDVIKHGLATGKEEQAE